MFFSLVYNRIDFLFSIHICIYIYTTSIGLKFIHRKNLCFIFWEFWLSFLLCKCFWSLHDSWPNLKLIECSMCVQIYLPPATQSRFIIAQEKKYFEFGWFAFFSYMCINMYICKTGILLRIARWKFKYKQFNFEKKRKN